MKKILTILILLLTCIPVFAEENEENNLCNTETSASNCGTSVDGASAGDEYAGSLSAVKDWRFNRKMAVNFDLFPFFFAVESGGIGFRTGFEYALNNSISIQANLCYLAVHSSRYWYNWDYDDEEIYRFSYLHSFRFQIECRWYPAGHYLRGIFINGGLQYQGVYSRYWFDNSGDLTQQSGGLNSFGIYKGIGYKLVIGRTRQGLILEPVIEYITAPMQRSLWLYANNYQLAYMGFIRGRFVFNAGVAF